MKIKDSIKGFFNPSKNPKIEKVFQYQSEHLPTFWLLGKTGAGKSSLIHAITSDSDVEIGDGFRPCTKSSLSYDFPANKPLMRFLDTRGLGEANYNAEEDLKACQGSANAIIIVMKAEEPEQSNVLNALQQIRKVNAKTQLLVVHTGIYLIDNEENRRKCIDFNKSQVEKVWRKTVNSVEVDFELEDGTSIGVDLLAAKMAEMLPILAQLIIEEDHSNLEAKNFSELIKDVLWYSSSAGAIDVVPAVGIVSVPLIQLKMLHSLANQYDLEWNKRRTAELLGTLGTGFTLQYSSQFAIRQMIKFIPAYGQTVGAATAGVFSFGATYALGRVACKYMYHTSKGETVSKKEMKKLYRSVFNSMKDVKKSEQ